MAQLNLHKLAGSGLLGLHFTPEELFIGYGQRKGRNYVIHALDTVDIQQHILEGGDFNQLTLIPVLQHALKINHIKTRRTVISFPVKFPWIRVLEIPNLPDKELARVVRLEVERLYLDSTVEKLIDYFPLDPERAKQDGGTTAVLSVAIPRNSVAPYVELLTAARLELVGLDLVEVNILKLAAQQGISFDDGITMILNFNMQSSDLMLMENRVLQLVRKVGQGKQQLREVLQRALPAGSSARKELPRLDFVLAEEYLPLAAEYVASLLGEIRRSIEFYLADIKRAEGNVTKVVLAGSGYWPANLTQILGQQLHLPMINLSFTNMSYVTSQVTFPEHFPACAVYAPVIGSILRGVA